MFPVHTWLPDAAEHAPAGTSTLLVGVLDKVGTFGMLTLCLPLFPNASRWAAPVIIVLAVVSILYGALMAIGQTDLMRLIAYTSVSHFGFIVLGIFSFTSLSISGASFYMFNHGISTGRAVPPGGLPDRAAPDALAAHRPTTAACSGSRRCSRARSSWRASRRSRCPACRRSSSEIMVLVGTFSRSHPAAARRRSSAWSSRRCTCC